MSSLPTRSLGVDYGRRNLGLAVSTHGLAPRPLPPLSARGLAFIKQDATDVIAVARKEGCEGIVVGLPVISSGNLARPSSDSQQGRRCRRFAEQIADGAFPWDIRVFLIDERNTTLFALNDMKASGMKKKKALQMKDSVAAALMLSAFYDAPGASVHVPPSTRLTSAL
ncbi:hypothetical protein ACKKBF_B14650 [Auxenochlorella protothecoides x Auxenochlorella symbiontica]